MRRRFRLYGEVGSAPVRGAEVDEGESLVKKDEREDLAGHAGNAHDRERDGDSMSPEIRRLAICWGGAHEIASPRRIEERELEADWRPS
jgi:hypothetical protein